MLTQVIELGTLTRSLALVKRAEAMVELAQAQAAEQATQFADLLRGTYVYSQTVDLCLAALAERLDKRRALLERAAALAARAPDPAVRESQLNLVPQLQRNMGPTWAIGFYGLTQYLDQAALQ